MRMKQYFVYIMTNKRNTVLYTGITSNIEKRVYEHKMKIIPGFTQKYNVDKLAYYEEFPDPESAIAAEKKIKGWTRQKKIKLIESHNIEWKDLSI
ncbi:MAG: endonuclease [Deltaproteobacteria bacterium RIFCSPHIGHO2_02_FULL_40_11]|nr:MAG: endonuclease [Deltaproteobacteria bacterium RIFCSPHIGHO2_02_FULL_40_11]